MERLRRLQQFWSWLPAFRAVAETEHLPTAAERLHLTPPALSRAIKQLEESLETPLFDRVGRRIQLNSAGRELLAAVRDAMRRLDDGVQAAVGQALVGPVRIAAPMPFLSMLVVPAVEAMLEEHPGLVPHLTSVGAEEGNAQLLAGTIDLMLVDDPVAHDHLTVQRLANIGYGLYCGVDHPLYDAESLDFDDVAPHRFAAPPVGLDHWPAGRPRRIGMVLSHLHIGVEVCATGRYLTVLPDLVARHHPQSDALRRLPFEAFGDTALFAVRRPPLTSGGVVDLALEHIEKRLGLLQAAIDR